MPTKLISQSPIYRALFEPEGKVLRPVVAVEESERTMPKHVLVVDDDRDHAESVAEARRVAAVDQGFGPLARWRERVGVSGTPATPPRGRSGTPPAFVEGLDARLGRITPPRMDIAGWLRGRGLGQYEPVFRNNQSMALCCRV